MTYYLQLTSIEKDEFSYYGNQCYYYLDVFDSEKRKIGNAMVPVVNTGIDYSSAYEFLCDYDLADEESRKDLAEVLGVDEIDEDWIDEYGCIDPDYLPREVCERIEDGEDEAMLDWYHEDFSEQSDGEGYMSLDTFAESYKAGILGRKLVDLDTSLPIGEIFSCRDVGGWFHAGAIQSTPDLFAQLAAQIADEMDNMDLTSACVNIRFDGDYEYEKKAEETMRLICIELAHIVMRSMSNLSEWSSDDWQRTFAIVILRVGKRMGYCYDDEDDEEPYEGVAKAVYNGLVSGEWTYKDAFYQHCSATIKHLESKNILPLTDRRYAEILADRNLDTINNLICGMAFNRH